MTMALETSARRTSDLGDRADRAVDDVDPHFAAAQFLQRLADRFDAALDIGLDDDVEVLDFAGRHLGEQGVEGHARTAAQLLLALHGCGGGRPARGRLSRR